MRLELFAPHAAEARKHFSTGSTAKRFLRGTHRFLNLHAAENSLEFLPKQCELTSTAQTYFCELTSSSKCPLNAVFNLDVRSALTLIVPRSLSSA